MTKNFLIRCKTYVLVRSYFYLISNLALQPLIPTFPTSLPQKLLFDLEAIEAEAEVLALGWLSAKVPNGDSIKK